MSNWNVTGHIRFRAKKAGKRAPVEEDAQTVAREMCLYAQRKWPDYVFEYESLGLYQPLSEQVKP
ncbi:MAG: hypothetical protein M0Q91_10080 [Methanoregula sp.]|jgi:hypothetical protein|nr:hypothetical protein [Methanoregula sp.]